MNLEQQLVELARVGLSLDAGITIEDLLISRTRSDYERIPFRHLLHALGDETEGARRGRRICTHVWAFDTECIVDARGYVPIAKRLAAMAGASDRLRDVEVEVRGVDTSLRYVLDDEPRRLPIAIAEDWVDLQALCTIMAELASGEQRFFGQREGQGAYLFFLSEVGAARVNELAAGHMVLSPVADWVFAAPSRAKRARVDPAPLADAIASYVSESRAVPYETSKRFAVNDQLSHPVFGAGIVVRSGHTQIDVLFGMDSERWRTGAADCPQLIRRARCNHQRCALSPRRTRRCLRGAARARMAMAGDGARDTRIGAERSGTPRRTARRRHDGRRSVDHPGDRAVATRRGKPRRR